MGLEIDVPHISISIVPIVSQPSLFGTWDLRSSRRCETNESLRRAPVAVRLCRSHPGPEEAIATAAHQPLDVVLE